jgi:hypothetical protein
MPEHKVVEVVPDPRNEGVFTIRVNGDALRDATPEELRSQSEAALREWQQAFAALLRRKLLQAREEPAGPGSPIADLIGA